MAGPIPLPDLTLNTATSQGPFRASQDGFWSDHSGWTVATSGSRANGALPDWLLYAAVGVAVLLIIKRKKG